MLIKIIMIGYSNTVTIFISFIQNRRNIRPYLLIFSSCYYSSYYLDLFQSVFHAFRLFFFSSLHLRIFTELSINLPMIMWWLLWKYHDYCYHNYFDNYLFSERKYKDFVEIRTALEDGDIDGALLDTYVAAEHKDEIFNEKIYVKEILDRPFGYGVVLSGAARNVQQRCRDYIQMQISEIFHTIQNSTKTLDVSSYNSVRLERVNRYSQVQFSSFLMEHLPVPFTWPLFEQCSSLPPAWAVSPLTLPSLYAPGLLGCSSLGLPLWFPLYCPLGLVSVWFHQRVATPTPNLFVLSPALPFAALLVSKASHYAFV